MQDFKMLLLNSGRKSEQIAIKHIYVQNTKNTKTLPRIDLVTYSRSGFDRKLL